MQVDESTKNKYRNGSGSKTLRLYFPDIDLTIPMESIVKESLSLTESLSESESIEFVGCISSQISVQVYGVSVELKNQAVEAYLANGNTPEIPIFKGIVDSVPMAANRNYKTISAFDALYTKGNMDIANWYKSLKFPLTIKQFRDSLFAYIGLEQVAASLPNDAIVIEKQYSPTTMQALSAIKAICQINAVFGIINRDGLFEYRTLPKTDSSAPTEEIEFYKKVDYQEYTVKPVDKLTIRQNESDEGVSYGDGENNYIIQGNFFTLNLDEETIQQMAENIYPNVDGFYYHPVEAVNNGLPWIEVGKDIVSYEVYDFENSRPGAAVYKAMSFYILSRTMTGIQALQDRYSADGDEFQRVFITDINSRVETIIEQVQEIVGTLEDYSLNYVPFTNTSKIYITDGNESSVGSTHFLVTKKTQVMVNMEYLIECDTTSDGLTFNDLIITVNYYLDQQFIDSRQPVESYTDGKHILGLFYLLSIEDVAPHEFEVRLIANGGNITINVGQAINVMAGQGLVRAAWDGRLEIKETIPMMQIKPMAKINTMGLTESVTMATQVPQTIGIISDTLGIIAIKPIARINTMGIAGEEVGITLKEVEET